MASKFHSLTGNSDLDDAIMKLHPEDDVFWIDSGSGMIQVVTLTLERAKRLDREILYYKGHTNKKGEPARFRLNGKVKTWKRDPGRILIPVKRGLYEYAQLTQHDLENFWVEKED